MDHSTVLPLTTSSAIISGNRSLPFEESILLLSLSDARDDDIKQSTTFTSEKDLGGKSDFVLVNALFFFI